jgi:hypothetical protein
MRDWTISVLVNGEWYPTPRYVPNTTQGEAYRIACAMFPGVLVRVS